MKAKPVLDDDLRRNRESSRSKLGGGFLSNDRDTKYVATAPDEKAEKQLSDLPEKSP